MCTDIDIIIVLSYYNRAIWAVIQIYYHSLRCLEITFFFSINRAYL